MTFREILMKDYEDMLTLKISIGYAKETYTYYIPEFIDYCGENYPDANAVTKDMVVAWLSSRSFTSSNTRTRALINIRTFTKYLAATGKQSYVIDDEFSLPIVRFVPVIMKDDEIKQFFFGVDNTVKSYDFPRKKYILPVLFRMIFCCGLRPAEPLKLRCEDVNLSTGDVYIRQSKRRTDRHILMSEDMLNLCRRYDLAIGSREWFFQYDNGKNLSTHWLDRQFRLCYKKSGLRLPKIPNPYSLRHCFATYTMMNWIDAGKDIMALLPYLSAYMGHTEIKHTLYYVHLLPERLKNSTGINWEILDSIYGEVGHE